jgi:hypothetical protein
MAAKPGRVNSVDCHRKLLDVFLDAIAVRGPLVLRALGQINMR